MIPLLQTSSLKDKVLTEKGVAVTSVVNRCSKYCKKKYIISIKCFTLRYLHFDQHLKKMDQQQYLLDLSDLLDRASLV